MRTSSTRISTSHRLSRRAAAHALLEALEQRQLLSVTFANADMNATWNYAATQLAGSIAFDNTGLITGGSLLNTDGITTTPAGTYAINSDGTLSIVDRHNTRSGAMDANKDVILAASPAGNAPTILLTGGGATFANADLAGTWNLAVNGEPGDTNGIGTIIFDSGGNITGGAIPDGVETFAITGGTYTLNTASGTFTASVIDQNHDLVFSTLTLTGAVNSSKDVLSLSPTDFNASANANTNLIVGVNTGGSGSYNLSDVTGTWVIANAKGNGWVNFDGNGNITSGTVVTSAGDSAVTGTYTVDSHGILTVSATFTTNGTAQALSFHGALNHSKQVMALNTTDVTLGNNITLLVASADHVNHAPNLTTISTLHAATSGQSFAIPFANLFAASNASDADSDTLQFQVTALTTGQLTLNGTPVTSAQLPLTVSAGDTLGWTAPIGMSASSVNAFSVTAFDGTLSSAAVAVTIQTVLPSVFTNTNAIGTWTSAGTGVTGSLVLDNGGNVTGTLTGADGTPITPADSYDLTETGQFSTGSGGAENGAMSITKDLIVTSDPTQAHDFNVLVSGHSATFANADLAGTWVFGTDGDRPGSNALGSIIFNSTGLVTGGTLRNGSGTKAIVGGDYTLNADGTLTIDVTSQTNQPGTTSTFTFVGAMNASKDVVALSASDLPTAVNNSDSRLMVMVHTSATDTNADAKGTWTITADGYGGSVVLDGAGHVTSGTVNNGGTTSALTGSYAFSGTTLNLTLTYGGKTRVFTGAINASHNAIVLNRVSTANSDALIVMVSSDNHAPTLTSVAPFATAIAAHPFTITYSDLIAAGNEKDLDGNTLGFQVTSLINGALTLNGNAVTTGALPVTVSIGDTLTWTPTVSSKGNISAFAVKAFDGTTTSFTAIPVVIKTVLQPTVTIAATHANASEINGTASGMGMFKLMRTDGILANPLNITLTVTGTAASGVSYTALSTEVHFDAGASSLLIPVTPIEDALAEGTQTVTLSVANTDTGAIYLIGSPASATVKIADAASTISINATKPNASEINGTSSGAGLLTVVRSGGDLALPQTVNFTLSGTAIAGTNYNVPTSASLTFNATASTGTVTFAPGQTSAAIPVNPLNDHVANSGPINVVCTINADAGPSYFISGTKNTATVKIADAASTIAVNATKPNASETNGTSSGAGSITVVRSGGDLTLPQTVKFTLSGTAVAGTNYNVPTSASLTFNATASTGTVLFAPGQNSIAIPVNPLNDLIVNNPALTVVCTVNADAGPSYFISATKGTATVKIADAAPTVSIVASKASATELNGQTTGLGKFTLTRTGLLTNPLTVNYTIGGTAANGTDYGASGTSPLTTSVTFLAGSANATITINPIDDGDMEPAETVLLTLAADGGPHYFIGAKSAATVSIANHTLAAATLNGALKNTPFTITYANLLAASGLSSTNGPITFKITAAKSGTLKKNGTAVVVNSTTLAAGESLSWTPANNATGTLQAFALVANDTLITSAQVVVSVLVT